MADLHLYLPDRLAERMGEHLPPDVNLSAICQQAIEQRIADALSGCQHTRAVCADCGSDLPPAAVDLQAERIRAGGPGPAAYGQMSSQG